MNERIKELAEQAGEEAVKSVPFFRTGRCQIPSWVNVFIEVRDKKFAELIVRECVDTLKKNISPLQMKSFVDEYSEGIPMSSKELQDRRRNCQIEGLLLGIEAIKKHFGVE
jgi:hypothetical protein